MASGARREWRNTWASRAKAERAGAPYIFLRDAHTKKMFWNENEREKKNKRKTNDFLRPCFYLFDFSQREVFSTYEFQSLYDPLGTFGENTFYTDLHRRAPSRINHSVIVLVHSPK